MPVVDNIGEVALSATEKPSGLHNNFIDSWLALVLIFVVQTQYEVRHESLRVFTLGERFSACMPQLVDVSLQNLAAPIVCLLDSTSVNPLGRLAA